MAKTQPSPIRKADKPLPVAAYDQNGKLVGIIMDPSAIQPLAGDGLEVDLTPAPAAEVGTPADAVGKVALLKKSVYGARDVAERERAAEALNRAAIIGLRTIHGRPPRGAA
jgi:hypothetical protein